MFKYHSHFAWSIGKSVFSGCDSLTSVSIPDSVTTIGAYAFGECDRLTNINVDKNNPAYCSVGGNLFNKSKSEFVHYATGKKDTHYTIPDGVIIIEEDAFYYCLELKTVTIGDSIKEIAKDAFKSSRYSIDLYCYAKEPPCGNLDNVGCYYILEENFNAWENSYKIDKEKIKIFSP